MNFKSITLWVVCAFFLIPSQPSCSMDSFHRVEGADPSTLTKENFQNIVVETVRECYQALNGPRGYTFPSYEDKLKGMCSIPGWDVSHRNYVYIDGHQTQFKVLSKKSDLTMSQAVHRVFNGTGTMDCLIASEFTDLRCLERVIGTDLFDKIALEGEEKNPSFNEIDTGIGSKIVENYMVIEEQGHIQKGTKAYIANVIYFSQRHLRSNAAGQNVFCLGVNQEGENIYMGYGPFFDMPKTKAQILDDLYMKYCKPSDLKPEEMVSMLLKNPILTQFPELLNIMEDRVVWDECQKDTQMPFYSTTLDYEKILNLLRSHRA